MKIFLAFLISLCTLFASAQTVPLTFTVIPTTDPDLAYRPLRGLYDWNFQNVVDIPTAGAPTGPYGLYYRFTMVCFQPCTYTTGQANQYDFSFFDQQINQAITAGMKFGFGIMHECGSCDVIRRFKCGLGPNNDPVPGAPPNTSYPWLLHQLMQADPIKDWVGSEGDWVPYYNGNTYLTYWENLNIALNAHIMSTSFNGVPYANVISYVEARGYADFGEWAIYESGGTPAQTDLTAATAKRILDATYNAYPNFKVLNLLGALSGTSGVASMPDAISPEVGAYALQARGGTTGIRFDSWGTDAGTNKGIYFGPSAWFISNPTVYGGFHFDTAIENRYKRALIGGEPISDNVNYSELLGPTGQVNATHLSELGNGNFCCGLGSNATVQSNMRAASKIMGYRYNLVAGGTMTQTIINGATANVTINIQNVGIAPTYEHWNTIYELRTPAGVLVATWNAAFDPYLLLPAGSPTVVSANFNITVTPGTYNLFLSFKDPVNYRAPLPLAITGRQTNGSYLVRSNISVINGTVTPTANAGSDQTITLPTNSVLLDASASISATSYVWTQVSGPNTAGLVSPNSTTCAANGLIQGVYVFRVSINGGCCTDDVQITVNGAPVVAFAGIDQTITNPPTSSVTLNGSGSTGSITSYTWTQISGPTTAGITSPSNVTTTVTGLAVGTYVFRLAVNGLASTDNISIFVNGITPVANAGSDLGITLPINTVTVSGALSAGTITSYAWTQISGPSTATIATPSSVSTNISALIQGLYIFRLALNGNPSINDDVTVTVDPAVGGSGTHIYTTQTVSAVNFNDGVPITLGVRFKSTTNGFITGVRFYKTVTNTGTHIGALYNSAGTLLAQATFAGETASGWQEVTFSSPVAITANVNYVAAYFSPTGVYNAVSNFYLTDVVNTPVIGVADNITAHNGIYHYGVVLGFPSDYTSLNTHPSYQVDISFSPSGATPPGQIILHFPIYFQRGR